MQRRIRTTACLIVLAAILAGCKLPTNTDTSPGDDSPAVPVAGPDIAVTLGGKQIASGSVTDAFAGASPGSPKIVSFSIENVGDRTLELAETEPIRIQGPDGGLFAVNEPPGSLQLPPSASTTFSISFTLDSPGIRTAILILCSNDPDCGQFPLTMTNMLSRGHLISAGWYHSAAVTDSGSVWTWGYNAYGQLGDGTTADRTEPVPVPGLSGVMSVAAGGHHTLALKSDGTVWAWGENLAGELGDGSTERRTSPVQAVGLSSAVAIAAGAHHSVALRSDGTVWTWGFQTGRTTPGIVPGLSGIIAVSAGGGWFTLALEPDGTVWAWGRNHRGQLGDGTTTDRSSPVRVSGLTEARAIAAGVDCSAAARDDGTAWAWGGYVDQLVPLQVTGVAQVTGLAGGHLPVALRCDGTLWRLAFASGASEIDGLSDIVGVAAGEAHWLALGSDGSLLAWGDDYRGQLGSGVRGYRTQPVQVTGLSGVTAIAAGDAHSLALDAAGDLWAWGTSRVGQLGIGSWSSGPGLRGFSTPQAVVGLLAPSAVSASRETSFALEPEGDFWAWGCTPLGISPAPEQFTALSGVTSAAASMRGTGIELAMLRNDGTVWYYFTSTINGQITGLADIVSLDGYRGHSVLKADGSVWQWDHETAAAQVAGISDVVSLAYGAGHWVAATSEGSVWTWGSNEAGQLGDGTTDYRSSPAQVAGIADVIQVAAGSSYSLALKSAGTVWAWGSNALGCLGDGTTTNRTAPVEVSGLTGATTISACGSGLHCLALDSYGTVWAWGSNSCAQIGDGVSLYLITPVTVHGLRLW